MTAHTWDGASDALEAHKDACGEAEDFGQVGPRRSSTTFQPARVIAGHCPTCGLLLVIHNNHETWPLVACSCGWRGGTDEVADYVRLERVTR